MRASLAVTGLVLTLASPAAGQLPPGLDAGAPEGAELTERRDAAPDSYALPVGPFSRQLTPLRPLEGRVVRSAWRLDDAERTPEGVIAGYRRRLAEKGFETVFSCSDRGCGGFDFRFGVDLMPAPAMLMDTGDFSQLSMAAPDGRWASVLASRVFDAVYVQTVVVEGEEVVPLAPPVTSQPAAEPAPDPAGEPEPDGGDAPPSEPEAVPEAAPAEEPLLETLRRQGHVVLEGLEFEPGGAALARASDGALDALAESLKGAPDLDFALVGHSDNVGSLDTNIALSRRRAETVRAALVERGIAPDRLEAQGAGWLAPVATNATEEGRGRNRRVELVLR